MQLTAQIETIEASPGNWTAARDCLPAITVDQATGVVTISKQETTGHQKRATVGTPTCGASISPDGQAMLVRGEVTVKNWKHWQASGSQSFCFAVFVGDSGHIYTHRAPASKGWMALQPEKVLPRLRKLGIGSAKVAYQQGDFLLKHANGSAYPAEEFRHETMGAGHHKFVAPVLYADGARGRQYRVTEAVLLRHEAIDGIQHPDVVVEPGVYIVGTTATSLHHTNRRD